MSQRPASEAPVWEEDGRDWPNRESSRFVEAGGLRWHVQEMGEGPLVLLIHGTGAATHSWRDLLPLLARRCKVLAPDLPGHGFTTMPPPGKLSLPGMAGLLARLLDALDAKPTLAVGHSAGAAILARLCLDGRIAPRRLIALNGAFLPFRGTAGRVLGPVARLLASNMVLPRLFAWRAGDAEVVARLVRDTGSTIDARGLELYQRLARRPGHVAAALGMMANWDLQALVRDLPRLRTPLTLVVGANDRAIRPAEARRVSALVPDVTQIRLPRLGHLAHEEDPARIAGIILDALGSDSFH